MAENKHLFMLIESGETRTKVFVEADDHELALKEIHEHFKTYPWLNLSGATISELKIDDQAQDYLVSMENTHVPGVTNPVFVYAHQESNPLTHIEHTVRI